MTCTPTYRTRPRSPLREHKRTPGPVATCLQGTWHREAAGPSERYRNSRPMLSVPFCSLQCPPVTIRGLAHSRCLINISEKERNGNQEIRFFFFLSYTGSCEGERLSPHLPQYQDLRAQRPVGPQIRETTLPQVRSCINPQTCRSKASWALKPTDPTHSQRPRDHRSQSMHPQTAHPQLPGPSLSPQPRPEPLGA